MAGAATVDKALDVLFHLHRAGAPVGLSEIGRSLALPKSSCHRLLSSLVDREVVARDEAGRYRPGLALLALGIGAQRAEPVVVAARPVLEAEARALGETVFLVGLRHGRLRVLDEVAGSQLEVVLDLCVHALLPMRLRAQPPREEAAHQLTSSASTAATDSAYSCQVAASASSCALPVRVSS